MKPPHIKRTFIKNHQGFTVTMHVLSYAPIPPAFAVSCFADFVKKQGRKKLKKDVEITFPTLYGISRPQ